MQRDIRVPEPGAATPGEAFRRRHRSAQRSCLTYQMKASSNDGRVTSTRSTRAVDIDSATADPGSAPEGSDTRMLVPRRLVPGQRAASSA
ncbi:hypothetical protein GHK86_00145 [Acidimicrobiaceae bacterium USS-CC1]|uniref:Uncharacterized protein n=1 Tax=Acidiferrimicrobium australe TaxID=2664430 RepID=A0ABW9QNG3_9ACTN|nr:hypothetical protein [Acidiferrimicrobium australe]